jgi:hypothetical protein
MIAVRRYSRAVAHTGTSWWTEAGVEPAPAMFCCASITPPALSLADLR